MKTKINMISKTFGRLTVLSENGKNSRNDALWLCSCSCGNIKTVEGYSLRSGHTKSCGCLVSDKCSERGKAMWTKHGMAKTPTYQCWKSMNNRCRNDHKKYHNNYAGRGISVCKEWASSFEAFYNYMGDKPEGKTLDRIDNDGNYEPSNCRWATPTQQTRNSRTVVLNEVDVATIRKRAAQGERQEDIANDYGIHQTHVSQIKLRKLWGDLNDDAILRAKAQESDDE